MPAGRGAVDISDLVSLWEGRCVVEWAAPWEVHTIKVEHWDVPVRGLMREVTESVRCVG